MDNRASDDSEQQILEERGLTSPFTRGGLRRTPPRGFGTATVIPAELPTCGEGPPPSQGLVHGAETENSVRQEKRPLSSPEQVEQETKRRQLAPAGKSSPT